ncbi:SRPBCC family protein [Streptomyces sp. RPT161]|uniref:SRPBCC family protein n=1 Tax=Streptomyces sp. RPT161 TaxID=3015993 RepID=UPI0022B8F31F|nr:SRPBCC family protein [Streptomyces sp. RPT161]
MPEAFVSAVIPAQVTKVWLVVRDFGGLAIWQPAVADCVLSDAQAPDRVGCVRTLSMADGQTVVESLLALDDHARSLTYGIVSSPYFGWSVNFDCDQATPTSLRETSGPTSSPPDCEAWPTTPCIAGCRNWRFYNRRMSLSLTLE